MTEELIKSQNDISTVIKDLETSLTHQITEQNTLMQEQGQLISNQIAEREASLNESISIQIANLQTFVQTATNELHQKRVEVNNKYAQKFNKIKDVISKYFEKYDIDLEECKVNMKVLNQKYADWSKILIEPTSLNEARLFALETRIHEEEEIRIKEQEYMRDTIKKLIFSMEQTNLSNLETLQQTTARKTNESPPPPHMG